MAGEDKSIFADEGMLDLFRMEVEMHSSVLENGLIELEVDPGSSEKIKPLMRAAHSIKGAARIVGLDDAVRLAHKMEDLLCAAIENKTVLDAASIDALLQSGDVFKRLSKVKAADMAGWLEENQLELMAVEDRLRGHFSPGLESPASATEEAKGRPPESTVEPEATTVPAVFALEVEQKPELAEISPQVCKTSASSPSSSGGTVPVSAENLAALMGLAGECLVESQRLLSRVRALYELKSLLAKVPQTLEEIRAVAVQSRMGEEYKEIISRALKLSGKCRESLLRQLESFETYTLYWENLSNRLYNEALATKMRPFSDGMHGFPRMVRDIARKLGKRISFRVVGENTRVDRDVLAKLEAPLTHILRNACDHGIESPEDRLAAGKPAEGVIEVAASHRAGMLVVTITDDGRGIDIETIRRKVVEKGMVSKEMAEGLTEPELMDFLFLPGFSTAWKVTEESGRGVGLDVVLTMVQEIRGTVSARTTPDRGTSFSLELPVTLSTLRALLAEISGEAYAFPLTRLDRVLMVPRDRIELIEGRQYCSLNGQNIGLISASQPLGLEPASVECEHLPVVVVSDKLNMYGVVVDRLLGEIELVVRPLDLRLGKVPNIAAAAIREDGSPVLIIDTDDLVRSVDNLLNGGRIARIGQAQVQALLSGPRRILVVDDSITVREVERRLLENRGYEVEVAIDGMDGWNAVRTGKYDLVISDIDMPRMDGIEMVKNIKGNDETCHLPVIILSYKDREEDRIRGMEAGADYYLTKSSFYDESFMKAVTDLIGGPEDR